MSPDSPSPCAGCDLSRREFVVRAAALAAMLAGLPRALQASPLGVLQGERRGAEKAYPIPAGDGVQIDKEDEVILARHAGEVMAFALSCPHQHTALRWVENDGGRFECPKHHSKYRPDGVFISGRATRSMDRLPIRREGDQVLVDIDRAIRQDQDSSGWEAAKVLL